MNKAGYQPANESISKAFSIALSELVFIFEFEL